MIAAQRDRQIHGGQREGIKHVKAGDEGVNVGCGTESWSVHTEPFSMRAALLPNKIDLQ